MQILNNKDRIGGILLLAFSLVYLRYAFDLPVDETAGDESFSARTLPIGLSVSAIIFSLVQLINSVHGNEENSISAAIRGFRWKPMVLLTLLLVAYAQLFEILGFIASGFAFLMAGFLILGERRIVFSASVAGGLVFFLWLLLAKVFGLYLDSGDLFRAMTGWLS
jgi:putative tricarboxylic transport membrane protein